MDAKTFFGEFNALFAPESAKLEEAIFAYSHSTDYTNFIMDEINDIIKANNLKKSNEYFRIDAIGYTSRYEELADNAHLTPHLWDLEVAVEHENDSKDWLDEVIKLAHVCCPLRVVIGYVPWKERNNDLKLLEYAADALNRLNCKNNVAEGEFMVILGNSHVGKQVDRYFNYKAYCLDSKTFEFKPL